MQEFIQSVKSAKCFLWDFDGCFADTEKLHFIEIFDNLVDQLSSKSRGQGPYHSILFCEEFTETIKCFHCHEVESNRHILKVLC